MDHSAIRSGEFGEVPKTGKNSDGIDYEIKKVLLSKDTKKSLSKFDNLLKIKHSNVVRYYNCKIESTEISKEEYEKYFPLGADRSTQSGTTKLRVLYIQMELCEKNTLKTVIDNNSLYKDDEKIEKYFREICEGLAYLHKYNIAHRDLKPRNIFLTGDDTIKIGNFGFSEKMKHDFSEESLTSSSGTWYKAPEINSGMKKNRLKIKGDIYSLGVTYFEMCFKPMNTYERDELNPLHENIDYAEFFTKTPKKKHRIGKMLNIKRDQRPSCKEIIETLPSTSTSSARSKTEILQPAALTNTDTNGESSSTQSYAPSNAIDHSDSLENESETRATKETTEEGANLVVDSRYINILILGETGTGKSTFINSIANYYNYNDFDDANAHELLAPIPSAISLWDINGKQRDFSVGTPDKNETQGVGEAATQNVKTYDLPPVNGYILRLIDTPGMGDPRGVDKDDENCENILAHLTGYEKLHAICFLVKSNNSRITVLFEYCFKQILSRLDKSASNNIIFLFTNTVSDYYRGGNTYSCLKEILKHIKNRQPEVNINFDRNLFYLDNEAFRILAALHCGIELPDKMIKSAVESWDQSAVECKRLMSYIVGDSSNPPLPPHQLRNTISINEAKRLIDNIFKPLADISDSLEDNIRILESHEKKLSLDHENLEYMKDNLYIPVVNLKVEKLTQPVTTCKSENCVEYIQVEDKKLSHYKQRCHEPCYLKNVPELQVGHPNLSECQAMDLQGNCHNCGCHFQKHMHIYELTTKYSDRIQDKNMVDNIQTKEQAVKATKKIIKDLQDRRELLEKEQDGIIESTAMFAHFIQHNAITPFNEAYKFYIEFQINREKARGDLADKEQIHSLENMLQKYKAKKAAFDETLDIGLETTGHDKVTAEIVISRINNLQNLDFSGETLKQLMDVTIKCKEENSKRSWAHTSIEFVSKTLRNFKKSVGLGKSKARK